jgi:hypothetical protein
VSGGDSGDERKQHNQNPGFWMYETSGVLAPAVHAYLNHFQMTPHQIATMRAYLRQWVNASGWKDGNGELDSLRLSVEEIATREDIDRWIDAAIDLGIDPL